LRKSGLSLNIGFVFIHPPGESMGSLYRVRNLCQGLTFESHKCFIFAPFNYEEDWGPLVKFITIPAVGSGGKISKFIYKTVRKILDSKHFSNFTILNPKIFNYTIERISRGLHQKINEESIHLDVLIGETEIGGLVLKNIKERLNIPIIVDYQNYWPEELVEHKIIKRNGKQFKYLFEIEKDLINTADLIITPSHALRDYLLETFINIDKKKIKTVINGGTPVLNEPKTKKFPPKIINAGMVVHRSNFELFFNSIPYVLKKYPDAQIYITKKGEKLQEIMNLAKKMNIIDNITFYWKDTYQEFLELLSECHVGVVTSTYELTRKLGFVTKIYDYFSVGVPVVGNDIGGWTSIITDEQVGLLSTDDPKDLAEKILEFIDDPEKSHAYGKRAIELLKNRYSVKTSGNKLIERIQILLN